MATVPTAESFRPIRGNHVQQTQMPRVTASMSTFRVPIFVAPFRCELVSVFIIASATVTGANTNTVHLNLINGGAEGAGTTELAALDLVSGTDIDVGKTSLFATETFLDQGTMLELEAEEQGTGLGADMAEMLLYITYRPSNLAS